MPSADVAIIPILLSLSSHFYQFKLLHLPSIQHLPRVVQRPIRLRYGQRNMNVPHAITPLLLSPLKPFACVEPWLTDRSHGHIIFCLSLLPQNFKLQPMSFSLLAPPPPPLPSGVPFFSFNFDPLEVTKPSQSRLLSFFLAFSWEEVEPSREPAAPPRALFH